MRNVCARIGEFNQFCDVLTMAELNKSEKLFEFLVKSTMHSSSPTYNEESPSKDSPTHVIPPAFSLLPEWLTQQEPALTVRPFRKNNQEAPTEYPLLVSVEDAINVLDDFTEAFAAMESSQHSSQMSQLSQVVNDVYFGDDEYLSNFEEEEEEKDDGQQAAPNMEVVIHSRKRSYEETFHNHDTSSM